MHRPVVALHPVRMLGLMFLRRGVGRVLVATAAMLAFAYVPGEAAAQTPPTWSEFQQSCASDPLACGTEEARTGSPLPPLIFAPPTDQQYASFFPGEWGQLQYNQAHNPVFDVGPGAPPFLTPGAAWASPLTGDEFLRLARGIKRYGANGGENWGAEAAQWLGNVTGISVADGIMYVEESRNEIFAVDAATGIPIWRADTVSPDMGDALVETIGGKPVVFVAAGDVGFTVDHALNYAKIIPNKPGTRGANFSAVYAIDGLTGHELWHFDTEGEAMPTPVYRNGSVFFDTGDGHLYAVNASTGALESAFANPHAGFSSMSSANYYTTSAGQLYVVYGTQDPNFGSSAGSSLVAVNETNPVSPMLAWSHNVTNAINTGLGDVPVVVDQTMGLVITDALVRVSGVTNIAVIAINANTGALVWESLAGSGPISPFAFKGSVPMVHDGNVYVGDLLNETYQSYDEATGTRRWSTELAGADSRDLPGTTHQPRGGGVFWNGKVIEAEGLHIWTFDPNTGAILNDFMDPGYFGVWGITTPVIVGDEMYLGAISGWAFAVPAQYVTTNPGPGPGIPISQVLAGTGNLSVPATAVVSNKPASFFDPSALPTAAQAAGFPHDWLAYAGGQDHNAVLVGKPNSFSWKTPLTEALPLSSPPRDAAIFGDETATEMTSSAFGAGTGISPVDGIAYVGSDRYTVNALNAATGKLIWSFDTINANYGQPLVTPKSVVIASAGDPWFNFASVTAISQGLASHVGASFQNLHGLDPRTGQEKWTFYTQGTSMMTPAFDNGNLYWVNGTGDVWAINADTGSTFAPFEDSNGNPTLKVGGLNAIDSPNILRTGGRTLMVFGTADPTDFYAVDLSADTVAWKTSLPAGMTPYFTGFASASPVVDTQNGLVITSILVNADTTTNTVTDEAVALHASDGSVAWTHALGTGPIPVGYTAATPFLNGGRIVFADPVSRHEVSLRATTGDEEWSTSLGEQTKAPGLIIGNRVIQPAGPDIFTLNAKTGAITHTESVGGYFKDNGPTAVGETLYVGNSWGWAMALPLSTLRVSP